MMRWGTIGVALVGVVLFGLVPARADGSPVLRNGDRLKITFYETMEVPNPVASEKGQAGGAAAVMQTFYQRIDLSGEYGIEQGGVVSLPLFGSVPAAGKPLEALRTDLIGVFETAFGRHGGVTVALLQRSPVFVVGSVRAPGAYPYAAGMIVLQAVALAGGRDKDQATISGAIEAIREREREETIRGRLKRALARKAAVMAKQNGAPSGVMDRLRGLAPPDEVAALLAAEAKVVHLEHDLQAGEEESRKSAAEASFNEVDLLKKRLTAYGLQLSTRGDRLRTMEALFSRQVVESERVADVRRDFVDMEARRREYEVSVLQAESRQRLAKDAIEQGRTQQRLASEREIAVIDGEIAAAERALSTSSIVSSAMATTVSRDPSPSYRIVRSGVAGSQVLPAEETDLLEPGDVLKVVEGRSRESGDKDGLVRRPTPGPEASAR